MPQLTLLLVDGFADDEVLVTINGREVARRKPVTTKLLTGLADSLRFDVGSGACTVGVSVPTRGFQTEAVVEASTDVTLLANVSAGELRLTEGTGREGAM